MVSTSLQFAEGELRIHNFKNDFLLLSAVGQLQLGPIGEAIFNRQFDFIREVIVTESEICLQLQEDFKAEDLEELLALASETPTLGRTFRLPVHFGIHEDWTTITTTTGQSKDSVIEALCNVEFSVAMFGFLPGFLYLDGLPDNLQIPRKKVPAKYVAANSLAIGGRYLGLYAIQSPGGWHVVGRTPLPLLQFDTLPPSPFRTGDKIRLETISLERFEKLQQESPSILVYNG